MAILEFNLSFAEFFDGVVDISHFWDSVDDVESQFSCNLPFNYSFNIRGRHTKREEPEDDAEEASDDITSCVSSFIFVIFELFSDEDVADIEREAIREENDAHEKSECKTSIKMATNARFPRSSQELIKYSNFFLFLPEGTNDLDGIKRLVSISSTLGICFHVFHRASLLYFGKYKCAHGDDGEKCEKHKRKLPASPEGQSDTRETHANGENDCAHLLTECALDG